MRENPKNINFFIVRVNPNNQNFEIFVLVRDESLIPKLEKRLREMGLDFKSKIIYCG